MLAFAVALGASSVARACAALFTPTGGLTTWRAVSSLIMVLSQIGGVMLLVLCAVCVAGAVASRRRAAAQPALPEMRPLAAGPLTASVIPRQPLTT